MKFIIAFILLLPSLSHASNEQALINILDSKIGTKYQKTELTTSLETGVWSKDGNIYLSSITKNAASLVFVLLRVEDKFKFIDVSVLGNIQNEFKWAGIKADDPIELSLSLLKTMVRVIIY